jgi:predicted ATPase/DNA-binding SARP family transcriptional activator
LGTPKITRTDNSVNIQRRKGIALLSYLAVTAQPHSRDSLAAMFWPEYDQSGARGNLRRDLSRLKTELGDGALRIEADNVGMHPQLDLWLDVAEFQAGADRPQGHGHSLNGQGEPLCPGCLESLQRAVELYQGDFLGGLNLPDSPAFNEWQFFQSESLRQKMAIALQYLVRWYTYNRAFSEAIRYCRRWLAMDPLHEPAHRELMRLYAYDGQIAAALRQYQECARLLKTELGIDPESETTRLYEEIRSRKIGPVEAARAAAAPRAAAPPRDGTSPGDGASLQDGASLRDAKGPAQEAAPARPRHNLPTQSTPFVGRESELSEIKRLLFEDPSCRLVTLLGPGGSGKTRLGLQSGLLASRHEDQAFPDGVWFVQLAPLTEPASIVSAIAQALRRSFFLEQEHPERRLIENLRRERLLLILDNFEHLQSPEAVGLVSEILESAPGVKIMVTSRTRLNVRGEHLFFLGGLSVPGTGVSLAELSAGGGGYSALELFLQSARRMWPGFKLDESSYRTIVQICSQVQGMPLAIELAAGWLGALTIEEIKEEVESSLDFLESEWRDLPDRQRSLRAVFNSSWKLLSGEERQMVKALSIFRSGFSREAARAVAGASPKGLLGLMNKSWVGRQPDERYSIHELLRQYAFERLSLDSGNLRETQERYSSYYAGYGGSLWAMMQGPEQGKANKAIHLEFDNFGAAWSWFVSSEQIGRAVSNLLPPLFLYSEAHSKSFELLQMVAAALHSLPGPDGDPEHSFVEGVLTTVRGAFFKTGFPVRFETFGMFVPAEKEAIRRSWELVGSQSRPGSDGFWTIISAYLYGRALDYDGAIARFDELLPELRRQGRLWEWAFGLLHRETIVLSYQRFMSQPDQVDGNLEEARLVFQELGDRIQ